MNLVNRVKNILTNPKAEWQVINTETLTGMPLITSYLLPLAALAALATFIGYAFIVAYGSIKIGLIYAIMAIIQMVLSVYINSYVTDALAPSFSSEKNIGKSMQLVVYSATPAYVGSLLNIIPGIGWLGALIGGIYSLYIMYLGLPILKKTPEDKAPIYLIVIIVILAIVWWLIGYIMLKIFWSTLYSGVYVPY